MRLLAVCAAVVGLVASGSAGVSAQRSSSPAGADATARTAEIRRIADALQSEAKAAAAGDWNRWYDALAPFRSEMRTTVEANRARGVTLLEAPGTPPLFDDPNDLLYLWEDGDLTTWLKQRSSIAGVTQGSAWLKQRGVDVIFVPVPKMPEVYPDRIAKSVPADRIVAPQVRRLLLELLQANVEVVDLLPLFQAARREHDEPLFLSDDSHWSPRAQAIAASAIAERLKRYPFVRTAQGGPPQFREQPVATTYGDGCWRPFLTPAQLAQVRDYSWSGMQVVDLAQRGGADAPSPIMLIGDSFGWNALKPGMSLDALISRRVNLPMTSHTTSGGTVDAFRDFLREPELLNGRRVIVWVAYNGTVSDATSRWELPRVMAAPSGK